MISVSGDGTIAITLQSGTLPAGVTLASGVLSGTPSDSTDDVTLTFRATSTHGTADADVSCYDRWNRTFVDGVVKCNLDRERSDNRY